MWLMRTARKVIKSDDGKTFGDRLRLLRKAQGLTQGELGQSVGVSTRAVCSYECNICDPPVSVLIRLSTSLNVSLDEILGRKGTVVQKQDPAPRRWLRKIEQIQRLPEHKQKAIVQVLDMALKSAS